MIQDITPHNFPSYRNMVGKGYLVNVWPSNGTAKAHNLMCMHGACKTRLNMNDPQSYPKFFASTLQEAQQYSRQKFSVSCTACKLCK